MQPLVITGGFPCWNAKTEQIDAQCLTFSLFFMAKASESPQLVTNISSIFYDLPPDYFPRFFKKVFT